MNCSEKQGNNFKQISATEIHVTVRHVHNFSTGTHSSTGTDRCIYVHGHPDAVA